MGTWRFGTLAALVVALAAIACGSDRRLSGTGGSGPMGGAAGVTGGTKNGGTSGASGAGGSPASPLWTRAGITTCGTLGQGCTACAGDTICYFYGPNACVPNIGSSLRCAVGSCGPDKPYCIDDACMTLEQASCFCTANPGRAAPGCAVSPADHLAADAAATACTNAGAACGSTVPACCAGSACAAFGTDPYTCVKTCTGSTDCPSGCCVPLSGGPGSICGPATNCP